MDFLISKASENIVQDVLQKILDELGKFVDSYVLEYEYKPRDPPAARRRVMVRIIDPQNETLIRMIVFVMMRGGNPKRAMKNLDDKTRYAVQAIMDTLKVKKFSKDGMFSTWQWMTSFWDYVVVLASKHDALTNGLFLVGNHKFDRQLPKWAYVLGGLHPFKGVSDEQRKAIKQEIFRHQHFLIYIKNSLDPKKQKNNVDTDIYKANRIVQAGYLDFQMNADNNNFTDDQINAVCKVLGFDHGEYLKSKPLVTTHDWITDPYSAAIELFAKKV